MPIPTPEERLGTVLGSRYRLDRIIGRGGMGIVYAGEQLATGRQVAVKLLSPAVTMDAASRQRFIREARSAAALRHPYIVDVLDLDEDDPHTIYLVLELLEGETLSSLLSRKGVLTTRATAEIIVPILCALDAAHQYGLIHRDIKPDNIFIAKDALGHRIAKLLDFGVAKHIDTAVAATKTGATLGTPHYMSPEQAIATRDLTPRSDLWSVGVVLYECLTGVRPFEGTSTQEVLAAILTRPPIAIGVRNASIEMGVVATIERALAKDPAHRHPDARTFATALARATGTSDPWARDEPSTEQVTRASPLPAAVSRPVPMTRVSTASVPAPPRRSRAWIAAATVGALAILAVGAGIWQARPRAVGAATLRRAAKPDTFAPPQPSVPRAADAQPAVVRTERDPVAPTTSIERLVGEPAGRSTPTKRPARERMSARPVGAEPNVQGERPTRDPVRPVVRPVDPPSSVMRTW